MSMRDGNVATKDTVRWWAWLPLLAALLASYGPIGNNYGFALYFLNWSHGFVKRGLVGEMFAHAGFMSRGTLLGVELLFLAAAYGLTYVVFRRLLFEQSSAALLAAMLLAAPGGLPHLGYLFAQPDVTLYLIVLLCMLCWMHVPPRYAIWLVALLSCLAMLAHEAFLLMFYPLSAAILWRMCRRREVRWMAGVLSVAVVAAAWVAVVHFGKLKVAPDVVLREAMARTDVPVQRQVYDVMGSTLQEQFALVRRMYSSVVIRVLCVTLLLCAPYFWLLGKAAREVMRAEKWAGIDRAVFAVLMLCPLMLCAFGHDTTRWIGAACLDVSLFMLYVLMRGDAGGGALRAWAAKSDLHGWIAYLLLLGPLGATGLRVAEQMDVLWQMR